MNNNQPSTAPTTVSSASNIADHVSDFSDLVQRVQREPWQFEFRQAVRILALDAARRGTAMRDRLPAALRFRTPASLSFPPSELVATEIQDRDEKQLLMLYVSFFGLTGPSGVLPSRYTELLIDRQNHYRDYTLHNFLDLFSHRAVTLFHAANQKYRFYRQIEFGHRDGFSRNLLDLVGAGLDGLRGRLALTREPGEADRFLMYHAGIFAQKPIPSAGLEALIQGLLNVNVKLQQFQGNFVELGPEHQSCLGKHNGTLGVDTIVGSRQYDCQSKITLAIGPLPSKAFHELLPGGSAANALRELMRFCVGHALAIEVKLILQRDHVPAPHLSAQAPIPKQLGFNTWIHTQPVQTDCDDARYALQL